MKRMICMAMALTLMASLFVGCGCQNVSDREDGMITNDTTPMPTITTAPTHETTQPATTAPTTTTAPATETTRPQYTQPQGMESINGGTAGTNPTTDATDPSNGSVPSDAPRARGRMDGRN